MSIWLLIAANRLSATAVFNNAAVHFSDSGMSASPYGSPQRQYGVSSVNASHPNMGFSSANQQFINPEWFEKLPREIQQNPDILHRMNPHQSCVVICYNLPVDEMNVTKLFNLLSLYGAVLRIKILRDKPDTALAQFSHPLFATLACYYLAVSYFKFKESIFPDCRRRLNSFIYFCRMLLFSEKTMLNFKSGFLRTLR